MAQANSFETATVTCRLAPTVKKETASLPLHDCHDATCSILLPGPVC